MLIYTPFSIGTHNERVRSINLLGIFRNMGMEPVFYCDPKPLNEALYYAETEIDWDDYFYDMVGVTRILGEENQEVILKFSSATSPYVMTKPIHPTQI